MQRIRKTGSIVFVLILFHLMLPGNILADDGGKEGDTTEISITIKGTVHSTIEAGGPSRMTVGASGPSTIDIIAAEQVDVKVYTGDETDISIENRGSAAQTGDGPGTGRAYCGNAVGKTGGSQRTMGLVSAAAAVVLLALILWRWLIRAPSRREKSW